MKLFLLTTFAALARLASAEINYAYHEGLAASQVVSDTDGDQPATAGYELASEIAAPGSKDLVMMLSSEISLMTQTVARDSNKGGKTEASAEADVTVVVKYCVECQDNSTEEICASDEEDDVYEALPRGGIIFAARKQELSVDVDLDCECTVGDLDCECAITGYVEVDLTITTTAAHTFNFIADLAETGTGSTNTPVRAVACFYLSAAAEAMTDGDDASSSSANGYVGLQSTMFIVQEASTSNLLNTDTRRKNLRA